MSTVPLPCPFCGSCSIGAYDGSTFRWLAARCNECGATAGEVRINTLIPRDEAWPQANEDALQEWNRRAQPEPHWANEGHVGMAHGGQPQPEVQDEYPSVKQKRLLGEARAVLAAKGTK